MSFKEDTVVYLDDICIPHSWESVIKNINDKLYFKVYKINVLPEVEYNLVAAIEAGNYTGGDLAAEIQTELNSVIPITASPNLFTCSYVVKTNKITISINNPAFAFRIVTQPELKTIVGWNGI